MANFVTSKWYQIQLGDGGGSQSLTGTGLYTVSGAGAVFFQITNTTDPAQMWQLYPYNSTYYVLRTGASGKYGYMAAEIGSDSGSQNTGNTVPYMANVTIADNSMFWTITPWGDGTFYLTNAANGTNWHLNDNSNSLFAMSSDIVPPQSGQRFSFNVQGPIKNRPGFSSLVLPAAMSTSTNAITSSTTPTSSSPPNSGTNSSSGLSTGAKAGIGAGFGIVALIALLALGFCFLRRRKSRAPSPSSHPLTEDYSGERKSMIPTDPQELASFFDAHSSDNLKKPSLSPQELDPTAIAMHEMEAEKAMKGHSVSPYRPGVDNEPKAIMPERFFRENVAIEMDAYQHPMKISELPGTEGHGDGKRSVLKR